MSPKAKRAAFKCPRCNRRAEYIRTRRAEYIRTRYFERGTADVYTCNNKACVWYLAYFYNDHPK